MTYVIGSPCIDKMARLCVMECTVDAIYEGERTLYINPDECTECGACEPACPEAAIWHEDDLPDEEQQFTDIAVKWFAQTGASGGGTSIGKLGVDEPRVAEWPVA